MSLKKKLLKKSQLYAIIDKSILKASTLSCLVHRIKNTRVDIIQLRDKTSCKKTVLQDARLLHKAFSKSKTIFIVNDYLDIAMLVDSDGVHLGQDDIPIESARKLLGNDKIIGISCHSISQAIQAQKRGADYIGIGPVFNTATKPAQAPVGLALVKKCKERIKIPFFVIGGINLINVNQVVNAGATRIAVCSALLKAKNITKAIDNFKGILGHSS